MRFSINFIFAVLLVPFLIESCASDPKSWRTPATADLGSEDPVEKVLGHGMSGLVDDSLFPKISSNEPIETTYGHACGEATNKAVKFWSGLDLMAKNTDHKYKIARDEVRSAFALCLRLYLRIDTRNDLPKTDQDLQGHEDRAVRFFKAALVDKLGFENVDQPEQAQKPFYFRQKAYKASESLRPCDAPTSSSPTPSCPHRYNEARTDFIATVKSKTAPQIIDGAEASVILYHHMDTVPVIKEQWGTLATYPNLNDLTLSGAIGNDLMVLNESGDRVPECVPGDHNNHACPYYIFGRGALDMKYFGILHLMSVAMIQAQMKAGSISPNKTIHFIGSSDEEVGSKGATGLLSQMSSRGDLRDLRGVQIVLNEGGQGMALKEPINGALKDFPPLFLISTEEKGGAWLEMEHPNPVTLIQDIDYAMVNVALKSSAGYYKDDTNQDLPAGQCQLLGVVTPDSQVNVAPSKVSVALQCRNRGLENTLKEIFQFNFPKPGDGSSQAGVVNATVTSSDQNKSRYRLVDSVSGDGRFRPLEQNMDASDAGGSWYGYQIDIAMASSGHGSLADFTALQVLAHGLEKISILDGLDSIASLKAKGVAKPPYLNWVLTQGTDSLLSKLVTTGLVGASGMDGTGFVSISNVVGSAGGILMKDYNAIAKNLNSGNRILKIVGNSVVSEKLFRTSCTWTSLNWLRDAHKNATALNDCRLLHTYDPNVQKQIENQTGKTYANDGEVFIEQIKKRIDSGIDQKLLNGNKTDLAIRLQLGWDYSQSLWKKQITAAKNWRLGRAIDGAANHYGLGDIAKVYRIFDHRLKEVYKSSQSSPYLFPGGSDSTWFRNPADEGADIPLAAGSLKATIPSYGFSPVVVSEEVAHGFHGSNERFPVDQIIPSLSIYVNVLNDIVTLNTQD